MAKRGRPKKSNWGADQVTNAAPADPFADNGDGAVAVAEPPAEPAEKPKRGRKPKQKYLEGTEPFTIKELEDAAESYVAVRDHRMELTERECECKKLLAELMKKHQLETYAFDGQMIEYTHVDEDQVKVKKVRAAKDSPKATGDEEDE